MVMSDRSDMASNLEARGLTLKYDRAAIVTDLNLEIVPGETTILLGANGSGKSTLLQGLARLLKPHRGAVYLNGKDISRQPTRQVAQQLGILPQSPVAPEGLTVRELVSRGRYPHQGWLQGQSAEDERCIEAALVETGMAELAHRPLDRLSGGQRQRAWIAMAIAQDTDILLLDEPTSYLDLAHQIEVLDLLWHLNHNRNRTIVMVLHDLNLASRYGDRLLVLCQGRIIANGSPEAVMTEEIVRQAFDLDCRIVPDPVVGTPLCVPLSGVGQRHSQPLSEKI
jgi:iron complex transport system ATP-binding protein